MSKATERMLAESARFERRMLWRVAGMLAVGLAVLFAALHFWPWHG
jgi:hypothetical protein